jgi:hypothetical protein
MESLCHGGHEGVRKRTKDHELIDGWLSLCAAGVALGVAADAVGSLDFEF